MRLNLIPPPRQSMMSSGRIVHSVEMQTPADHKRFLADVPCGVKCVKPITTTVAVIKCVSNGSSVSRIFFSYLAIKLYNVGLFGAVKFATFSSLGATFGARYPHPRYTSFPIRDCCCTSEKCRHATGFELKLQVLTAVETI